MPDKRLTLTGSADISGTFSHQGRSITLQRSLLTVDGGRQGLQVGLDLAMSDGGRLKGSFSSAAPFSLVLPEHGHLTADASNIDLLLLKPWAARRHEAERANHRSGQWEHAAGTTF
ncbi:MAG: hypothetical protein IPQ16_15080 [Geobacteraceae bacterium]|nr:hypothetical protein [Geobacteraceae bacterium]